MDPRHNHVEGAPLIHVEGAHHVEGAPVSSQVEGAPVSSQVEGAIVWS